MIFRCFFSRIAGQSRDIIPFFPIEYTIPKLERMAHMNWILTLMAAAAVAGGLVSGRIEAVGEAALSRCGEAVSLVLSLTGALCLWSGLMEVARRAGLTQKLAALFRPAAARLFPGLREDGETLGLIAMNVTANLLGLGNAATPLGLAAMGRMAEHCPPGRPATREMITLVVLNTCSIQLIPATVSALRLAAGSAAPMEILPPMLAGSALSLAVSVGAGALCARLFPDRGEP